MIFRAWQDGLLEPIFIAIFLFSIVSPSAIALIGILSLISFFIDCLMNITSVGDD
jgi:hypothetical protein